MTTEGLSALALVLGACWAFMTHKRINNLEQHVSELFEIAEDRESDGPASLKPTRLKVPPASGGES